MPEETPTGARRAEAASAVLAEAALAAEGLRAGGELLDSARRKGIGDALNPYEKC